MELRGSAELGKFLVLHEEPAIVETSIHGFAQVNESQFVLSSQRVGLCKTVADGNTLAARDVLLYDLGLARIKTIRIELQGFLIGLCPLLVVPLAEVGRTRLR